MSKTQMYFKHNSHKRSNQKEYYNANVFTIQPVQHEVGMIWSGGTGDPGSPHV